MNSSDLTTRQLSAVIATDAVRPAPAQRALVAGPGDPPQLARLRRDLAGDDADAAAAAAHALLELLEPDSLAAAHASAFAGAGPAHARAVLRSAWDCFRHDRHRGAN